MKVNNQGQGMIEYLIMVALVAVATIGVVRVVGKNVTVQFANIARALGGVEGDELKAENPDEKLYRKKDLGDFMQGSTTTTKK